LTNVSSQASFHPAVAHLAQAEGLAGLWGLPVTFVWPYRDGEVAWTLRLITGVAGIGLTGLLAAGLGYAALRRTLAAERAMFSLVLVSGLMVLVLLLQENERAAGKALLYVYPFVILGLASFVYARQVDWPRPAAWAALGGVVVWLSAQTGWSLYQPYSARAIGAMHTTLTGAPAETAHQRDDFDLTPLTDFLEANPPTRLAVAAPRYQTLTETGEQDWPFALYSMFGFSRYQPYFQSGLIVDNNAATPTVWLERMEAPPDYVVVLRSLDYVGEAGLGTLVAENGDLALYRITTNELAPFAEATLAFQQREPTALVGLR
jgi:hypothetical protein